VSPGAGLVGEGQDGAVVGGQAERAAGDRILCPRHLDQSVEIDTTHLGLLPREDQVDAPIGDDQKWMRNDGELGPFLDGTEVITGQDLLAGAKEVAEPLPLRSEVHGSVEDAVTPMR
jgi:hypothetical protein